MPRVSTLPEFRDAVAGFTVEDLPIDVEPAALQAARSSIAPCGLMLGEVHGVAPWMPPGPGESEWTARDRRMAETLLARQLSGGCLVVAGNAHTGLVATSDGVPMGAWLARSRPGLRTITIRYGHGGFYNLGSRRFPESRRGPTRLHLTGETLVLDLPHPTEAIVMHR
jgi:hypothetical protein